LSGFFFLNLPLKAGGKLPQDEIIILTHFGMRMLQSKPWEVAARLSADSGKKVIAARDGMALDIDEILKG
jgi:hypothetical protein